MAGTLTLEATDVRDADHWYWRLSDAAGRFLGDHEVTLDPTEWEYAAFLDPHDYLERAVSPDKRPAEEPRILAELGAWIGRRVLGPLGEKILEAGTPAVVRVVIRGDARQPAEVSRAVMFRPLELAHARGTPLALQDVSLVFEPPEPPPAIERQPVGERLRVLAVFSLPLGAGALNLRHERYQLKQMLQSIARTQGLAIDVRVLQYGVTRAALKEILAESPGWDVLHFSGHGLAAALILEKPDGSPDMVSSDDLASLVRVARGRLKWVTLSACLSAAATAAEVLRALGLRPVRPRAAEPEEPTPAPPLPALAQAMVNALDCAVLAMRYPVADRFAIELSEALYQGVLGQGQSLARALQLALPKILSRPGRCPALSVATPALFGRRAADLTLAAPRAPACIDERELVLFDFPEPSAHLVGRVDVLVAANRALAVQSGSTGVLFHGMAGAGKTSCAVEIAWQYEDLRRFQHFVWYKAPDQQSDVDRALVDFAAAMERKVLELKMVHLVDRAEDLAGFLPKLTELLRCRSVLIVLDNLETLLRPSGAWRDPRWAGLVDALLAHRGDSRVVMTSRVVPEFGAAVAPKVLRLAVHALSLDEAALLARQMPHLGPMLEGDPAANAQEREAQRRLIVETLQVVQGHPKLIDLADRQAADPQALRGHLERAAAAWAAGQARLGAFFDQGESALTDVDFLGALAGWTVALSATLSPSAQTLFRFLCLLEEEDRESSIVDPVWPRFWKRCLAECPGEVGGTGEAPELPPLLERLAGVGLVEIKPLGALSEGPQPAQGPAERYVIHPGVAAAVQSAQDQFSPIQRAVDAELAPFWLAVHRHGIETETRGGGPLVIMAGRRAARYLIRQERWDEASTLLEQVIQRDESPGTIAAVLPLLRGIATATKGTGRGLVDAGVLATAVWHAGRWEEAEAILWDAVRMAQEQGNFRAASAMLGYIVNIMLATGRAEQALAVVDEMKEATRRAPLGPWTQLGDECTRLQLLVALGRYDEVLSEVEALRVRMQELPESSGQEEAAVPWNVREVVLDTGHTAALSLEKWEQALSLNHEIAASNDARGAPALEVARTRFNDYKPLLGLQRYADAGALLGACRRVYEAEGYLAGLGNVFSALADLEDKLGHRGRAIAMEETSLRYTYLAVAPEDCAGSHFNLANYLMRAGAAAESALAHRLASAVLYLRTASGRLAWTIQGLVRHFASLDPDTLRECLAATATFADVVRLVEQVEGVRFAELVERLPTDRAATGEDALQQVFAMVEEASRKGAKAPREEEP